MTNKFFSKQVLLLIILACASPFFQGQQLATLNVILCDPSGSVIPGAHVTLSNSGTGLTRTQLANRAGVAVLTALNAGDYRLTVTADGFSDFGQSLTLSVGQVASVTAQLGVAAVKQTVAVTDFRLL